MVSILSILLMCSKYDKLKRKTSLLLNSVGYSAPKRPNTITKQNDIKYIMKEFNLGDYKLKH